MVAVVPSPIRMSYIQGIAKVTSDILTVTLIFMVIVKDREPRFAFPAIVKDVLWLL